METSNRGIALIKSYEALRLQAYADPGTGGDPWTVGYGTTKGVTPGMIITKQEAEDMFLRDVRDCEFAVNGLLDGLDVSQPEFDALVSFVYNCGVSAFRYSTLLKRLLKGDPRCRVYQEELNRWIKGGDGGDEEMPGLISRRQEEADMACKGYYYKSELPNKDRPKELTEASPGPAFRFPLDVPYYTQLDSEVRGQAERSCFSSSMAMALEYVDPEGIDGDDWYLREVLKRGDTVSSTAQVETARALGYDVEFHMDGTEQDLLDQLDKGIPIPIGILHKGHVDKPTGGGHYIVLTGYDDKYFYVNDPMGELDLIGGGYPWATRGKGEGLKYTRKNTLKRWLIDGSGADGWWSKINP